MAKKKLPPPTREACEHVLVKIKKASEPLDARALVKLLEPPFEVAVKDLAPILDEYVGSGILFCYPGKTAQGAARYWDRDFNAIGRDAALAALKQADLPLTAKDLAAHLKGPIKFVEKDLIPILAEAATSGLIYQFRPKTAKGKSRYWAHDVLEYGRRMVLQTLQAKGPLPAEKLRTTLKEIDSQQIEEVLRRLRDEKVLFVHPRMKSGPDLIGITPPAPETYLQVIQVELTKTIKKLLAASVPLDTLRRAIVQVVEAAGISITASGSATKVPSVDLVRLMLRLEPGASRGALVGARDLRRAASMPKDAFDLAIFELAREGRVSLHRHDYPASLTESERDELITDGNGHYFIGIALREPGVRTSSVN